ncbi:hypothetical protein [Sporomusa ovata]|uniref:hypothetical protein n=1 Tax=Sporomusa ovata TaxID=2378 RepID=UPI001268E582|nr:hypothetical protein [Sporomusa ovata]
MLGDATNAVATLEQTICGITPGCPYKFSFSVNAQNLSGNAQFLAEVFWQPSNSPAIDPSVNPIVIDQRFSGNNYVFIKRITSIAPAGTTCARIVFTKHGNRNTGTVLVDDVSFSG